MQSQSSQGIWLRRWWPISGNCSSSDSWCPTSPPSTTAAWVWRTPRSISRARTSQGKWATVQWGYLLILKAFNLPSENSFHFRRGQRINMPPRKKQPHSLYQVYLNAKLKHQQICPSVQKTGKKKRIYCIHCVTDSIAKKKLLKQAKIHVGIYKIKDIIPQKHVT